jgi:molybdopterin/thiamine biosynthesis adenylyltransferase
MRDILATSPETLDRCRDDRTVRALTTLVGHDRANLALTHFTATSVEVAATAPSLSTTNGFLAAVAATNMLSRFVGAVTLRIVGNAPSSLLHPLQEQVELIRRIDSRAGRSIELLYATPRRDSARLRLWLGADLPADLRTDGGAIIAVGFDGWACWLRREMVAGPVVPSSLPFGAIAAACFGVAEIFKTLLADTVDPSLQLRVRRRFVDSWRFSTWAMDREMEPCNGTARGPDTLPRVALDEVMQVGAGAVGNGSVLAFREIAAVQGVLRVIDPKLVDSSNLNRCYYFTEDVVGAPKVKVLQARASRTGFLVQGEQRTLGMKADRPPYIMLSTVDNNAVRHQIQEAIPAYVVQGSTGGTTATVSVHTAVDERSCLVCRHPDPTLGVARARPLSIAEAAAATGLPEAVIESARFNESMEITDAVINIVGAHNTEMAAVLRLAKEQGQDLCGALGDLRRRFGILEGPNEASVSFVSVLAGVLAAAEITKLLLRREYAETVPVLDNVFSVDLAMNYARHETLSFREPARTDCMLCRARQTSVRMLYERFHGLMAS